MQDGLLKVGELAKRTGLSVRTLHYYDEIGLLEPSQYTAAGYRLYALAAIRRLQQIVSLRQVGFSLDEIRDCLDGRQLSLQSVIQLHIDRLREHIELQRRLCDRLQRIAERLCSAEEVSVDELIHTIEVTTMSEKYYTPEQLEYLKQRKRIVGEERIQQVQAEWTDLFQRFKLEMEKGSDPAGEPVQALARKSMSLIQEFTGGDAGIERSLGRMYQEEGASNVLGRHGYQLDQGVFDYMSAATKALKQSGEAT